MDELNDQIEQRIKKLDRLRSLVIDPFGGKFNVKDSAPDIIARYTQATKEALASTPVLVTLAGRVTALRRFGKAAFASVQDGPASLQVYLKKDVLGEPGFALAELLDIADWIGVSGPLFRNEGISTIHNPEFTMLEFYIAYADYHDLIELTEELITTLVNEVHGQGAEAIPYRPSLTDERTLTISFTRPWKRMTYRDAVREHLGAKVQEIIDPAFALAQAKQHHCELKGGESYWQLLSLLFEELVEPTLINPTFITDFPVELSPLAKRNAADPELTDRFELYIAGREMANAFSELNDPLDQRKRFEAQVAERAKGDLEAQHLDEDFLRALEHGMPPTAGEGIGIDRLVMLLTNQPSIRDVILFPQLRPEK